MTRRSARIRMHDKATDPRLDHSPPVVVWRCPERHRLLRVFVTRSEWHLLGDRFHVPTADWLARGGGEWTEDDLREGRVAAFESGRVVGVDRTLPLDIDTWPAGARFEVACRCKPVTVGLVTVGLDMLAEDCRRARDERICVNRTIG